MNFVNDAHRFINELKWNFIQCSANYIIPLFTFTYIIRQIDKQIYGELILIYSYGFFIQSVMDFGTSVYGTSALVKTKNLIKKRKIITNILALKSLVFIAIILSIYIFTIFELVDRILYLYTLSLYISSLWSEYIYRSIEKSYVNAILQWLSGSIYLILIISYIDLNSTLIDVIIIQLFSNIVALIISIIMLIKLNLIYTRINLLNILQLIGKTSGICFSRISVGCISPLNIFFITNIGGNKIAADYGVANNINNMIKGFYTPVADAALPALSKNNKNITRFLKLFIISNFINIFIIAILYIFSNYIILYFAGNIYESSSLYFQLILLSTLIAFPNYIVGYPILSSIGKINIANSSAIIGLIVFLTLAMLGYLLSILSVVYLIVAMIIGELSIFIIRLLTIWIYYK